MVVGHTARRPVQNGHDETHCWKELLGKPSHLGDNMPGPVPTGRLILEGVIAHIGQGVLPARTATLRHTVALLRGWKFQVGIIWLGHPVPMVQLMQRGLIPALAVWTALSAGAEILGGGWIAKPALIMKAAYLVDLFDDFGTAPANVGAKAKGKKAPEAIAA